MKMGQRSTVNACSVCCSLPHKSPLLLSPTLHRPPQHGPHVSRKGSLIAEVGLFEADCCAFSAPLVALPDGAPRSGTLVGQEAIRGQQRISAPHDETPRQ